tara:strand:- start:639 stop:821 length:183 start_codon:yes stop_codon:yes gene_type:complete
MAKKRKLNSKNPKYMQETQDNKPKIKERRLLCNVPIRNLNKEIVEGRTAAMYGIWYEDED